MAVRTSMAALISRLRRYIGDPSGASQHFIDQDCQDALDEHRFTVRYAPLRAAPTLIPGSGGYNYTDYYADVGEWEDDLILSWNDFTTLTPATSEPIAGHWTFSLAPPGQYPNVFITGKYYDLHATAADLLDQWAAALTPTTYDFTSDGQSFRRSQIVQGMLANAATHRAKAYATTTAIHRDDTQSGPAGLASGLIGARDGSS